MLDKERCFLDEVKGGKGKGSLDPDDTTKARKFYVDFWGQTLSDRVSDYDGAVGHYRGETIISFNTMAGCMIRLLPAVYKKGFVMPSAQKKRLNIICDEKNGVNQSIREKFAEFYNIYHSRANFMPLAKGKLNLNIVKGGSPYHDFPDLFFKDLRELIFANFSNRKAEGIFFDETNIKYFEKFDNWKAFVELNYLQDYFEPEDASYSKFVPLAPPDKVIMPYRGSIKTLDKKPDDEKAACIKYIDDFLDTAMEIIKKRAERLSKGPAKHIAKEQ